MKYPKLSAAAKATKEFEVLNEGTWLSEEHMQNAEAALTANETALAEATSNEQTANATIQQHETTIAERDVTIASLQSQLAEAKKDPAVDFENKGTGEKPEQPQKSLTPSIDAYAESLGY